MDTDPTELAPTETATESVHAWGLAEYDEEYPTARLTAGRITALAVVGSVAALAVAAVIGWQHLRTEAAPTASMVPAAPMTTAAVPAAEEAPPSPTVVTITTVIKQVPPGWLPTTAKKAPPPVAQEPTMTAYDRQFLQALQDRWGFTERCSEARTFPRSARSWRTRRRWM